MADKTITQYEPVADDIVGVSVLYEGGVVVCLQVSLAVRRDDGEADIKQFDVMAGDLSGSHEDNLNSLVSEAVTQAITKYGF